MKRPFDWPAAEALARFAAEQGPNLYDQYKKMGFMGNKMQQEILKDVVSVFCHLPEGVPPA